MAGCLTWIITVAVSLLSNFWNPMHNAALSVRMQAPTHLVIVQDAFKTTSQPSWRHDTHRRHRCDVCVRLKQLACATSLVDCARLISLWNCLKFLVLFGQLPVRAVGTREGCAVLQNAVPGAWLSLIDGYKTN